MASKRSKKHAPVNYQDEISNMMFGLGDTAEPNHETVLRVESIVLQQLRSLLEQAYQVSVERGKNVISNYEIIYLIHKNKNVLKLKRLHDFQKAQDMFDNVQINAEIDEVLASGTGKVVYETTGLVKRRRRTHSKIIKELEGANAVLKINHDYLGHIRKIRAKKVTDDMTSDEYDPFHIARCTSFRTNNAYKQGLIKVRRWVDPDKNFKITSSALEVLCFIGYETVADLIDAVLLSRRSKQIGFNCGFSSMQLDNGISLQWPITVNEVNEALAKYFTSNVWFNDLFYKNMGLEYLEGLGS